MMSFLKNSLKPKCAIGLVGGSDLDKAVEQMGGKSFSELVTLTNTFAKKINVIIPQIYPTSTTCSPKMD